MPACVQPPARALPQPWPTCGGAPPCGRPAASRRRCQPHATRSPGAGVRLSTASRARGGGAAAAAAGGSAPPATARVYRATCPLVGWEPLEAALRGSFPPQLALHHFVVLEALGGSWDDGSSSSRPGSSAAGSPNVVAFDFLPQDPLSPLTAAALLSGGWVPGELRRRPLAGVPRLRCELQGSTQLPDPHAAAAAFQRRFDPRLRLLQNDCTHHAEQLIAHLLQKNGGILK